MARLKDRVQNAPPSFENQPVQNKRHTFSSSREKQRYLGIEAGRRHSLSKKSACGELQVYAVRLLPRKYRRSVRCRAQPLYLLTTPDRFGPSAQQQSTELALSSDAGQAGSFRPWDKHF